MRQERETPMEYVQFTVEHDTVEADPLPPATQSGRSKHKGKSTRGNHRSGLRGKGREAFNRNKWMKDVI